MRTRVGFAAVTAAAAVAALLATTAPAPAGPAPATGARAGASSVSLSDGTGDLWVIGPGEDDWDPFGGHKPTIEVLGGSVRHGARAVVSTIRFEDLRVGHWEEFSVRVRSDRPFRRVLVTVDADHPAGTHRLLNRAEDRLACPGLRHRVDYGTDTVRVRLPRSCVGDPAWVRVALAAYLFRRWDTISDNPHNAGPEPSYTRRLRAVPPR